MATGEPKAISPQRRRSLSRAGQHDDPFRPLEPECQVLQFDQPLSADELLKAGKLFRSRPDVQLYAYGRASRNLDFLDYFPGLQRLQLALYDLDDVAGLALIAGSLRELRFGPTRKKVSLRFLGTMPCLSALFLAGHKKDIAAIQTAPISQLGLSMLTLPDLSVFLPLDKLSDLSIILGGTRNLALLPQFRRLEKLTLMRISKMADLAIIAELSSLRELYLEGMRNVSTLPNLSLLTSLRRVRLDTMKGLTDLSPVGAAPALEELNITNMPQLDVDSFRCLVGHSQLKTIWAYTGRTKVNQAIKHMFPGIAR